MKILENISYFPDTGIDGIGDLYLPDNISKNTCVALCIHGGGWSTLDKSRMAGFSAFLCRELKMAVYNINYRLSADFKWPAGGDDCLAAAWALLNGDIAELAPVKPEKILISGASSGGHYALMTGLRLPPERVSGIISLSGINSVKEDFPLSPGRYTTLFGHAPTAGEFSSIDPVNFLTPQSPPILCTHDVDDNVVPCQCSRTFAARAEALGVRCSTYFYRQDESGYSHRLFIKDTVQLYPDIAAAAAKFIRKEVMNYIPEPQPQKSSIEISAFYYPGTEQMAEWDQIEQTRPELKPLLGWYDESNPELIDWQIKWAVEHGISSFCVDWYWNRGVQRLDHWIKAFYQAHFRTYLKWYIMWANHNDTGAHSEADQINVTRFWIENYFRTPEYYTIDGHPVVVLWSLAHLDRDFRLEAEARGETMPEGEGIKRAIELSNREMRKAGLPDIHFICMYQGMTYAPEKIAAARDAGFKEQMIYNFFGLSYNLAPEAGRPGDTLKRHNFDCVLASAPKWWQLTAAKELDFSVVPILSTGWNDQPRTFENVRMIYDRTPEKFRKLCQSCKEFCEKNDRKRVIIAPLNEWQEGCYIEPNEEFGFEMYNALRDTFCTEPPEGFPPDLLPADTGRGPYDYPPMEHLDKSSWDFTSDTQNWYRQPFGTAHLQIIDNALHFFRSGGDHAALRTRLKPFPAKNFTRFKVMMKVTPPRHEKDPDREEVVRLYFGTTERPLFSKELCIYREGAVAVPAISDSQYHEYTLELSTSPLWQGMINELWFDPPQQYSTRIDIRWMKLLP